MGSIDQSKWMSALNGKKYISEFSIPGTHDSCATAANLNKNYIKGIGIGGAAGFVAGSPVFFIGPILGIVVGAAAGAITVAVTTDISLTQKLTIMEQLNAGVRYFDIRLRWFNKKLRTYHGIADLNLDFEDVLEDCYNFLSSSSEECIVMQISQAGKPEDSGFDKKFAEQIKNDLDKWYLDHAIPLLGKVRGKIILLRRFDLKNPTTGISGWDNSGNGIDVTSWGNDTTFEIHLPKGQGGNLNQLIEVQDEYKFTDADKKLKVVRDSLDHAEQTYQDINSVYKNALYLNFTSATGSGAPGASPEQLAKNINPKVNSVIEGEHNKRFGVIPMDFVSAGICEAIIRTNTDLTGVMGRLVKIFRETSSNKINFATSFDGANWSSEIDTKLTANKKPDWEIFGSADNLYTVFIKNDSSNKIQIASTVDGKTWSNATDIMAGGSPLTSQVAPRLIKYESTLYLVYTNSDNSFGVATSEDGSNWKIYINPIKIGSLTPQTDIDFDLDLLSSNIYILYKTSVSFRDPSNSLRLEGTICVFYFNQATGFSSDIGVIDRRISKPPSVLSFNDKLNLFLTFDKTISVFQSEGEQQGRISWDYQYDINQIEVNEIVSVDSYMDNAYVWFYDPNGNLKIMASPPLTKNNEWKIATSLTRNPRTGVIQEGKEALININTQYSATVFQNKLYVAYRSSFNNYLYTVSSKDGINWDIPYGITFTNHFQSSDATPALGVIDNKLHIVYKINNESNYILVTSSSDTFYWSNALFNLAECTPESPSVVFWNNKLYVAYKANDPSNAIYLTSYDGNSWGSPSKIIFKQAGVPPGYHSTSAAPFITTFNGQLCILLKSNDPGNYLILTSSSDGVNWNVVYVKDEHNNNISIDTSPGGAVYNGQLYIFYTKPNSSRIYVTTVKNDFSFGAPYSIPNHATLSSVTPVLFNNKLSLIYTDIINSPTIISSSDGNNWSAPSPIPNEGIEVYPPLTDIDDKIYSVYVVSGVVYYQIFDKTSNTLSDPQTIPHDLINQPQFVITNQSPSVTHYGSKLFVFYKLYLPIDKFVYYASYDMSLNQWGKTGFITDITVDQAPSLTNFSNTLCIAYKISDPSTDIYFRYYTDAGWHTPILISDKAGSTPTLAFLKDTLYIFYKSGNNNDVYVACSKTIFTWGSSRFYNSTTRGPLSLVNYKDKLFLAFSQNDSSNRIVIASCDTPTSDINNAGTWTFLQDTNITSTVAPQLFVAGDKLMLSGRDEHGVLFVVCLNDFISSL